MHPVVHQQALQGRVERSLPDLERVRRYALDMLGDAVAVIRAA